MRSGKKNKFSKTSACSEAVEEIHYFLATTGHFHLAQSLKGALPLSHFSSLMRPEGICVWPSWKLQQEPKRLSQRSEPDFLWKPSARTLPELDSVFTRRGEHLLASFTPNSGWIASSGRAAVWAEQLVSCMDERKLKGTQGADHFKSQGRFRFKKKKSPSNWFRAPTTLKQWSCRSKWVAQKK